MDTPPKFTYRDLKYATDEAMFERARKLFVDGKVQNFQADFTGYSAKVIGTSPYQVHVSQKAVDVGLCECYMGQNDELCKHMIALALTALQQSGLANDQGYSTEKPPETLPKRKKLATAGFNKIKPYTGPSRIWFSYQAKLDIGTAMIREAIQGLEPGEINARFLWNVVKRIDRKLTGGVDDSNGTVWPVASEIIMVLAEWARKDPELTMLIKNFSKQKTNFEYHKELEKAL